MHAPSPHTRVILMHRAPGTPPPAPQPVPVHLVAEHGPPTASLFGLVLAAGVLAWVAIFAAGWHAGRAATSPTLACGEVLS